LTTGLIFDVKRYSINDGPGIRTTVFLKGCPLRCPWCHNPEGQSFLPEIMLRPKRCLEDCAECIDACEPGALAKTGEAPVLEKTACNLCGRCAVVCPTGAIDIVGRRVDAAEVIREVERDRVFYEESGGGATFSGGEPLAQPDFLAEALAGCRDRGIHTAVDTCGYAPPEALALVAGLADLFLFDIKLMDEKRHDDITGQPNGVILENLRRLVRLGRKIAIRLPLVAGVNDDETDIKETAEFLAGLGGIADISLLPYHKLGGDKYRGLGKTNRAGGRLAAPSEETLRRIKRDLEARGFRVRLGE
jgi:pyruvate formate lyase activating enzyme